MTKQRKKKQNATPPGKRKLVLWSIPFILIGAGFAIWSILGVIIFIGKNIEAAQYSKDCVVIEGEVTVANRQWIKEAGKHGSSYWGYKGDIVYTNENGEQAIFKIDEYIKKELVVGQKIKLIYQPDAPQDVDRAIYHFLLFRYVPEQLYINPLAIFSLLLFVLVGYAFLWLGFDCLWDDGNEPKERLSEKLYRFEQNIALSKFGTLFFLLFFGAISISENGIFNPLKACWTEAVVEGMELHRVSEASGEFTEYYRYECCVIAPEGETFTGYIIEEPKWEIGDRLEVLWYEGINPQKELNTPESFRENLIPLLFPLGAGLLWGYYEIRYRIALKEEKRERG